LLDLQIGILSEFAEGASKFRDWTGLIVRTCSYFPPLATCPCGRSVRCLGLCSRCYARGRWKRVRV